LTALLLCLLVTLGRWLYLLRQALLCCRLPLVLLAGCCSACSEGRLVLQPCAGVWTDPT
jgi:hypothetical protein